jgi:hypothetical protein
VHVTGFDPVHVPFWQLSLCVHALPSLQVVPLAATGFEHAPVLGLHVPAVWHASLAAHVTGLDPVHTPAWHVSVFVHALPSLHDVPFAATGFEQAPLVGSHVPATWHASLAAHTTGLAPVQTPPWHVSLVVHALPSLHAVPLAAVGLEHVPVPGSQVPATWHASLAVHVTGFDPVHVPFWQLSLCVHALPSLQAVPFVAMGFEHAPLVGSHVPAVWHASLAVHVTGFDPVHTPAWQVYVWSHLLVPVHVVPLLAAVWLHVPSALQASTVHGLPSSHFAALQHSPPVLSMLVS